MRVGGRTWAQRSETGSSHALASPFFFFIIHLPEFEGVLRSFAMADYGQSTRLVRLESSRFEYKNKVREN